MKNITKTIIMNRRDFVQTSAMAALGAAILPFPLAPDNRHIGVQLYSVKEDIENDLEGTLKEIAKIGYNEVETFGYNNGKFFDLAPKEFKKILKDYELKTPSGHYGFPFKKHEIGKPISDEVKKIVDTAAAMGQRYAIFPWVDVKDRTDENLKKIIDMLNKAAEYAKTLNLTIGYHNHDFEFTTKSEGIIWFDHLAKDLSPDVVFELDVYWVNKAKQNVIELFKRHGARFHLLHLKDMADSDERETIEIGAGMIDFEEIIKNKRLGGCKYYVVELEHYRTTPLKGIKECYKAVDKLLTPKKK